MSTTKTTKAPARPQETTPEITKDDNIKMLSLEERVQQIVARLEPVIETLQSYEGISEHDVTLLWDVKAIQGNGKQFARVRGTSTLNDLLAPHAILNALQRVDEEIMNKIVTPMVGAFQDEANRQALEGLAAKEAGVAHDDLTDDDLR